MDRLFIDANVLFSAAYRSGAGVARLWKLDAVELLSSDYAIEEARRNLSEPGQRGRLDDLLASLELVAEATLDEAFFEMLDLRPKDWPILGGAMAGRASHLITGDHRDFGSFFGREIGGVMVLPPADYLRQRESRQSGAPERLGILLPHRQFPTPRTKPWNTGRHRNRTSRFAQAPDSTWGFQATRSATSFGGVSINCSEGTSIAVHLGPLWIVPGQQSWVW